LPEGFGLLYCRLFPRVTPMTTHDDHHTPGSMDMSQHQRAYAGFLTFTKWSLAFILLIMAFLAIFRTHG
jgi:hypothetical protein